MKFFIQAEKDHISFYKNSTSQTSTFIRSKVVYFRSVSYIKYSTLRKQSLHCHKMFRITARQWKLQWEQWRRYSILQGFIQAILMSGRRHKKLNLLIEFSNSFFIKSNFKAFWHQNYVQNTLVYQVSSILSCLFFHQM